MHRDSPLTFPPDFLLFNATPISVSYIYIYTYILMSEEPPIPTMFLLECMIYIVGANPTIYRFQENQLSNMVSECLEGGHVFNSPYIYFLNLLNPKEATLFTQFIKPTCKPKKRLPLREGVRAHNINCGTKSYKLKLLGKWLFNSFNLFIFPYTQQIITVVAQFCSCHLIF